MTYLDDIIRHCEMAKCAKPIRECIWSESMEFPQINTAIYIIEEINGDMVKTFNDFSAYKNLGIRSCPKLNKPSSTLYVGSSITGLKRRIKEHIGDGHSQTYALNLRHWFKGNYEISILFYDVDPKVLQLIEDSISFNRRPAFGKLGGNNKCS